MHSEQNWRQTNVIHRPTTRRTMLRLLGASVAAGLAGTWKRSVSGAFAGAPPAVTPPTLQQTRRSNPARTDVLDASGAWLATFTDGASTVALAGPNRTFGEATASHSVTTNVWVRLLPAPFAGTLDPSWLNQELGDTSLDIFGHGDAVHQERAPGLRQLRTADCR